MSTKIVVREEPDGELTPCLNISGGRLTFEQARRQHPGALLHVTHTCKVCGRILNPGSGQYCDRDAP